MNVFLRYKTLRSTEICLSADVDNNISQSNNIKLVAKGYGTTVKQIRKKKNFTIAIAKLHHVLQSVQGARRLSALITIFWASEVSKLN